jgi:NAD(P)-dependent dehydrogenase (short-subunit alcohol dehydrogenase family)
VAVKNLGVFGIGRTSGEARRSLQALYGDSDSAPVADDGAGRYQRLAGRVVVITGSAQGFGKGIAEELARDGAHLIIADINEEKGLETCGMINEQSSNNSAVFCRTDVTSEDSLDACIQQAVRSFGGVDMFIANAGILKAGALHELDPKAFELVTKVNYSAYYLCARAAAPVMKLQNSYNPRYSMDIIQVNSKSGLQGSNKNFAYAGSKFGTIGLTQSFAMELIEYSIKVNSVCPGNFFDGPLWSDPKNGLFVQYLNAGKVPGAKTIEDVRRFYVNKVPMRRGCLPRDVARAIVYAHEQEYETGQAIPVTGGQVMLK